MKVHLLLGIRFHGRWSRQASGRLSKVKYTGNSLGGDLKRSLKASGRLREVVVEASLTVYIYIYCQLCLCKVKIH